MKDKFYKDTRTLAEFTEEYRNQKKALQTMNYRNLSEQDKDLIDSFEDNKEFLNDARNALDFVKSSTLCFTDISEKNKVKIEVASLLDSKEEYASAVFNLTGGFNNNFMKTVEKTRVEPVVPAELSLYEYNACIKAPIKSETIQEELEKQYNGHTPEQTVQIITVADVAQSIEMANNYEQQYGIDENIVAQTLSTLYSERENGTVNKFEVNAIELNINKKKDKEEIEEPVEIVESNDGYVMNHSKMTAANYKTLDERIDDKTVHGNTTRETTSDISQVGGNIKYEAAEAYGSLEEEKITSGGSLDYETEKDFYEDKNELHPDDKIQIEKSSKKAEKELSFDR